MDIEQRNSQADSGDTDKRTAIQPSEPLETLSAPPDGGYGWVVVAGLFAIQLQWLGITNTFGVLLTTILAEFQTDPATASWVGSIQAGLVLVTGVATGPFLHITGWRPMALFGATMTTVGFLSSSFVKSIYLLYFTYGVLTGVGMGMVNSTAYVVTSSYFVKKRALAIGIGVSGGGLGIVLFAQVSELLVSSMAWHWVLRVLAAISVLGIIAAALFRPLNKVTTPVILELTNPAFIPPKQDRVSVLDDVPSIVSKRRRFSCSDLPDFIARRRFRTTSTNSGTDVPSSWSNCGGNRPETERGNDASGALLNSSSHSHDSGRDWLNGIRQTGAGEYADTLASRRVSRPHQAGDGQGFLLGIEIIEGVRDNPLTPLDISKPSKLRKCCAFNLFLEPKFLLVGVIAILFNFCHAVSFVYMPTSALAKGVDAKKAATLISIAGVGNFLGKVGFGLLGVWGPKTRLHLYSGCAVFGGLAGVLNPFCTSFPALVVHSIVYGLTGGGWTALGPVVVVDLFGIHRVQVSMGQYLAIGGVGQIVGPPLAGILFNWTDDVNSTFWLAGGAASFAGLLMFFGLVLPANCIRRSRQDKAISD